MPEPTIKITLEAARVNARMTQPQVASKLSQQFGHTISRQRVASFEKRPDNVPPVFAKALSDIYQMPIDYLSFSLPVSQP